jgi:hypothetical protein
MRRSAATLALALLAVACAPVAPTPATPIEALKAQVDQRVELRGEFGGLAKDGWFFRSGGVPITIVGAALATGRVGAPVRVRGVLRYAGDPNPTGCGSDGQPCDVVAGREGFTVTDAQVEFEP